ncbi:MAG: sulfotransferase [Desulfobacterales bacterium]|nr:sulfotransferase [Desulfobacterales bacterium]
MEYVFVSGMFRSGTTLLARMLNTHSQIVFASDPMRPLFNSYRHTIADDRYKNCHDRYDPLGDYFLKDIMLLKQILASDLNARIDETLNDLFEIVVGQAKAYSGLWASTLQVKRDIKTYKELIQYFLVHIENTYVENKAIEVVGFKEVWANEMVPAFLNSFPDSKSIIVVRDPRDVTASNNSTPAKYPLFFLGRQWRKLAFLGKYIEKQYPGRVLLLRYEDLVENPEQVVKSLCSFVEVPFESSLLDPSNYVDGNNKPWKQNTKYGYKAKQTINKNSLGKWRTILERSDLLIIELIARDWMEIYGYDTSISLSTLIKEPASSFRRWPNRELSGWIRAHSFDENNDSFASEIIREKLRLQYIYSDLHLTDEDDFSLQSSKCAIFME